MCFIFFAFKDFEGNNLLIRLKEEPEDSTRKVPCLSDLSEDGKSELLTINTICFEHLD